jgi:hypothetical protein
VGVVDEKVAAKSSRSIIVNAASAICHIAHNEGLDSGTELRQDIGDGGGKDQKAFGELKSHALGSGGAHSVDCLGDLEGVVFGEKLHGFLDFRVVENFGRDLVQGSGSPSRRSYR